MEWVITEAKSVDDAIDRALDSLGVHKTEAEIEVIEEPKQGFLGWSRGNARVRARVKPRETRPKVERGRRKRPRQGARNSDAAKGGGASGDNSRGKDGGRRDRSKGKRNGGDRANNAKARSDRSERSNGGADTKNENAGGAKDATGGTKQSNRNSRQKGPAVEEATIEEVSTHVEEFLSGLAEAFGVEAPVRVDAPESDVIVGVVDGRHGLMVGPKGRTLDAIQELARASAQRSKPSSVRIRVDVGGYRQIRREALEKFATDTAEAAKEDGVERALEPMSSADRKVIHDALAGYGGIETKSVGNEPRRRVVIVPLVEAEASE